MIVVVCSAVIERDGSFLVVKEFKKSASGKWGIPGGKLEEGETIQQCLKREVQEETGFSIKSYSLIRIVNKPMTHEGNTVIKFIFLCDLSEESISVAEHEYEFLSLEQLADLDREGLIRGQEIVPLFREVMAKSGKTKTGYDELIQIV
ncbi:MAG TPA: NUDIX hydrolase [Patescibacteria group bacterium]|jgi:8-oxo-dGTP diphosphatase|nr:NUDIX hydrolase [Patescibacteria group bacterium]